jgi:hypothetical protein
LYLISDVYIVIYRLQEYKIINNIQACLIRVRKSTHSAHHPQYVVVSGIYAYSGAEVSTDSVVGDSEEESSVVDTRKIASTRRLVLLRLESEGVDVNTNGRDVGVVLVGLHPVEVVTIAHLEAIVTVELEESSDGRVLTSHALDAGDGVSRLEYRAIPPVGVVEGLLSLPGVDDGVIAADERVTLDNPDKLLTRVVEVELELVGRGGDGFTASELENVDEVLVGDLGEFPALISVEVDVVDIERSSGETALTDAVADGVGVRGVGVVPAEVVEGVELEVDADLVVLEGDQGESKTRVAAEPELEGDVEGVHGGARSHDLRGEGLTAIAVIIASGTALNEEVGELGDVTNHLGITSLLTRLLGELIPDVEPVTVVLINALTTDLNLDVGDEVVTDPVEPTELGTRAIGGLELYLREGSLEVHAVDQVTIALDSASNLLTEVGGAVERILDGLHGEVSVPAVHYLKKCDLRVTCKVNILSTISYELHKTTTCHFLYIHG